MLIPWSEGMGPRKVAGYPHPVRPSGLGLTCRVMQFYTMECIVMQSYTARGVHKTRSEAFLHKPAWPPA